MTATSSPASTDRLTSSTARIGVSPCRKVRRSRSAAIGDVWLVSTEAGELTPNPVACSCSCGGGDADRERAYVEPQGPSDAAEQTTTPSGRV